MKTDEHAHPVSPVIAMPARGDDRVGSRWAVASVMGTIVLFPLMQRWLEHVLHLPEASFRSTVLAWEVLRAMTTTPAGLVAVVPMMVVLVLRFREITSPWSPAMCNVGVRALMILLVSWGTWYAATLDHNLFFDQSYNIDRLLLLALAVGAAWRPAFVLLFLFLFVTMEGQFMHPFGRQIFANKIIEILLTLFAAWFGVSALLRRRDPRDFVFAATVLLASYYWVPGYTKFARGWFSYGQLSLGGFASHVNGWLAVWPVERMESLLRVGASLNWVAGLATLVVELGALVFFVHRRVSYALLGSWAALHVGIWIFSGVSFLVWIAVDVSFLALYAARRDHLEIFFRPRVAIAAAALMLLSPLWARPPAVGWFDTRLVYTYRFEAVDDQGTRGAFPADALPLGEAWCARDFPFLIESPSLLVRYGKTNDRVLADRVAVLNATPEALSALEREAGTVYFDPGQAELFDHLLGDVLRHWNERRGAQHVLSWAAPPRTCLSPRTSPEPAIETDRRIREIVVYQVAYLLDGEHIREVRRRPVRTVRPSS